eukprot:CAMPEP_0174287270 /NCGR_PEP_ID=MMETSP0809-20121228/15136_1 /TAXON_ID=73025 ORGANISM="Eutreptiella gymnastica-like, Strain CCMP1594" /NCGR_SAMPLE_ID=MMETSP0809 /ASSEMBLY_ACC=CAM_ASM_000658 /LENGTH=158 /DNA_ID=CAMNT_0015383739 /DNA_START=89 /DNA_END=565 /DNA_ORIENTATION=-
MDCDESPSPDGDVLNKDKKFGANSYHYWHNHGKDRAASGDVAPPPKHELVATETRMVDKRVENIAKYAFSDGKKKVQVYVDWPGVGANAHKVKVNFEKQQFDLRIEEENVDYRLFVPNLRNEIIPEQSTFKVKENQIVINCQKLEEISWYELKKPASP